MSCPITEAIAALEQKIQALEDAGKTSFDTYKEMQDLLLELQWIDSTVNASEVSTRDLKPSPTLDTLPNYNPDVRTMTYAGIGSRETPKEVLALMTKASTWLEAKGYTLNTGITFYGREEGADKAFSDGAKRKNLFSPERYGNNKITQKLVDELHPNPSALKPGGRQLMARNANQVFGANLDKPVDFVLFYANEKAGSIRPEGGTGHAVEIARRKGIPTVNMQDADWRKQLKEILSANKPTTKKSPVVVIQKTWYTRDDVAKDSNSVYLFGDNTEDRVAKYIPKATQAVIRGLPNALGIDTKRNRGTSKDSYFDDSKEAVYKRYIDKVFAKIEQLQKEGKTIVLPADGIGTGKALLQEKAPKLYRYLAAKLNKLAGDDNYMLINDAKQKFTKKSLNINYGTNENKQLSNLAYRPFEYKGKKFVSVEHAYQTYKSGALDENTYKNSRWNNVQRGETVKVAGKLGTKTAGDWNLKLMQELLRVSFEQNENARSTLLATGDAELTHRQGDIVWSKQFPEMLMKEREYWKNKETPSAETNDKSAKIDKLTADEVAEGLDCMKKGH